MAGWGSSQLQKLTNLDLDENPWTGCLPGAWRNKHIDFIVSEHPSFCTD